LYDEAVHLALKQTSNDDAIENIQKILHLHASRLVICIIQHLLLEFAH